MNVRNSLIPAGLLLFFLVSCGQDIGEKSRFVVPLDSITLGMKRSDVERKLPISSGTWQSATLFSSLLGITESTLTNRGLVNVYLFYRKDGDDVLLNAAVLEFSSREEARLLTEATRRYGTNRNRVWQPENSIRIEMESPRNGRLKMIYDTTQPHR
ncbi:MAG TPA: hypothetical protein PK297_10035 [Spirochaetota bacterium]|nr:hypothetical protein [Spirochaetota bacterium]